MRQREKHPYSAHLSLASSIWVVWNPASGLDREEVA